MLLVSQSLFDIIEWLYLCLLLLLKTKLPTKKSRSSSDHLGGDTVLFIFMYPRGGCG